MKIQNKWNTICILFALLTLFSSLSQAMEGVARDVHLHILFRFLICTIAILSTVVFDWMPSKPALALVTHYLVALALVMALVCLSQFIAPLHPNAYRDVFFNFSAIYAAVIAAEHLFGNRSAQRQPPPGNAPPPP